MSPAIAVPFQPPIVSAGAAMFTNGTRGRRRTLSFHFGGTNWNVRLVAPRPAAKGLTLRLTDGSATVWLKLNDWNVIPQVTELAGGAFDALPPEIQSIVLEAALAPALDAIGNAVGSAWCTEEISPWPDERMQMVGLELRDESGGMRRGELALEPAAAEVLLEWLQRIPSTPWRNLDDVGLPVRLLLGETRIAASEAAGLRPHDVLLVERTFVAAEAGLEAIPALALIGERTAFEATITGGVATLGPKAIAPSESDADCVRFEIAAPPMSLAAAKSLKPGDVVAPSVGGENNVRLTRRQRRFGAGSLVVCADRLGVRLALDAAPTVVGRD